MEFKVGERVMVFNSGIYNLATITAILPVYFRVRYDDSNSEVWVFKKHVCKYNEFECDNENVIMDLDSGAVITNITGEPYYKQSNIEVLNIQPSTDLNTCNFPNCSEEVFEACGSCYVYLCFDHGQNSDCIIHK